MAMPSQHDLVAIFGATHQFGQLCLGVGDGYAHRNAPPIIGPFDKLDWQLVQFKPRRGRRGRRPHSVYRLGVGPAAPSGNRSACRAGIAAGLLAEARAAQHLPWEPTRVSLYRTIFPQMTLWLPEDEGTQLRFEFETELERLATA
jgi:hypothetical protein